MKAFLVMGRSLKAIYEDLFLCVFLSIGWWVAMIPAIFLGTVAFAPFPSLEAVVGAPLAVLLIILILVVIAMFTVAPVTMGLHHATNRLANYRRVDNSFFWQGLRANMRKGWLLFLASTLVPVAVIANILFYLSRGGWLGIIGFAWVWLLLLVLMAGQYVFPLIWQQDEPDVKLALRNALLLAVRHPLYSILMLIFQLALLVISGALVILLILLYPGAIAMTQNFALAGLLQEMGLAPEPPEVSAR